jgi:hypothetical protein
VPVDLNGRKFGNSFLKFSDATLEIGHRGDRPFSRWSLRVEKAAHRLLAKLFRIWSWIEQKTSSGAHKNSVRILARSSTNSSHGEAREVKSKSKKRSRSPENPG